MKKREQKLKSEKRYKGYSSKNVQRMEQSIRGKNMIRVVNPEKKKKQKKISNSKLGR